ncbi:AAA family ATPase [Candidatus Cardinium hertigii]|uniref:AAA family ATPase n=1 Tax=Candidatus Cardinium hertigii TaxID=247481 RepID=UPI003D7D550A
MFGYTQEEILHVFSENIHAIGLEWSKKGSKQITDLEVMGHMATHYNGYKFHKDGVSVYNPWSTLKFLNTGELENYWYESGSPTILINQMLADPDRFNLHIENLQIEATKEDLMYTGSRHEISLKSLMFQTGYLTIYGLLWIYWSIYFKIPKQRNRRVFSEKYKVESRKECKRLLYTRA